MIKSSICSLTQNRHISHLHTESVVWIVVDISSSKVGKDNFWSRARGKCMRLTAKIPQNGNLR